MLKLITSGYNPQRRKVAARSGLITALSISFVLSQHGSLAGQSPVLLGASGNYAILAKSGVSTVPASAVTGDMGVSPIDSTAITGFSLTQDSTTQFSTSPQVTGKIYAPDFASPTPSNLTTAVSDMETAYTDAAGRTLPDFTELGAGDIGGMTLAPGLYKWGTGLNIPADVTLAGGPSDVWIFQIAGSVTMAAAKSVLLSGGAQAANIFWQVAGGIGVDLGTTSHFEGIILSQAAINLNTGASINGRLLAQTAVTLDANTVTAPLLITRTLALSFGPIARALDGTVALSVTNTTGVEFTLQSSTDLANWATLATPTPANSPFLTTDSTIAAGQMMRFYRAFYR
ncbi:MAG TPA: ice-binding family protein [Verrucomicrobiae bacterium]|nr:ice-binding family protein [Verrucomicrobiae bacterium]